jgi:uncharacterized protein YdeI (YjbR/CyaY-like superfamily)
MNPKFFPTPVGFRAWLETNHAKVTELVVGFHKKGSGKPSITWPESVDEALCFGWIDGVRRSLGETAYTIRFTPRRPTSIWSAINVARVAELTRLGRMREAGLRAFAARTPERTGIYGFERKEKAKLSKPQAKRLRANRKAAAFFDSQPPGYRATALHWVVSAKQNETQERRLSQLIADSAAGRRIGPLRRPEPKTTRTPRRRVSSSARAPARRRP